jgi:integrase
VIRALSAADLVVAAGRGQPIPPELMVSSRSQFGHGTWHFHEEDLPRLLLYTERALTISWEGNNSDAGSRLPAPVLTVLKSFSFLYLNEPSSVITRATTPSNHPRTLCQTMHTFLAFLGHVFESEFLPTDDDTFSFADMTLSHLRRALGSWGGGNQERIRRVLAGLVSMLMTKVCPGMTPPWSEFDVDTLEFRQPDKRKLDDYVLPGPLFRLLSNGATDTVCGFLRLLGRTPYCEEAGRVPGFLEDKTQLGASMFDDYVELRHTRTGETRAAHLKKVGKPCAATLDKRFRASYGIRIASWLDYLHQVQRAACAAVGLYTGGRHSDVTFFQVGCLQTKAGMWFLMGTHIKHQDIRKPMGEDPWPAIPILRDAVAVLEELARISLNPYLLSSLETAGDKRPFSPNGLVGCLDDFLADVDVDGTWSQVRLTTQRFRNTLAHQLARADVALPFIARHLKHLNSSLNSLPPEVTLTYGGIAELKVERAMQAQGLRDAMARSLYDLNAPVAGGGAPEFIAKRKDFYIGRMEAGMTQEAICDELIAMGLPLSSTGPGFCKGRRPIAQPDGTTRKPPCLGSLTCSPSCHNALITRVHKAVWIKVERQNRSLAARPELSYAREDIDIKLQEAQKVLHDLETAP